MTNLTLVNLDDLKVLLAENEIKNEVWESKKAADYLDISVPTLHKLAEDGEVPGKKLGKNWKFSSIALYQYINPYARR